MRVALWGKSVEGGRMITMVLWVLGMNEFLDKRTSFRKRTKMKCQSGLVKA